MLDIQSLEKDPSNDPCDKYFSLSPQDRRSLAIWFFIASQKLVSMVTRKEKGNTTDSRSDYLRR